MKIAYYSGKMFSDVDLSYLHEAQKESDVTYFVPIHKGNLCGAAFNIKKQYPHTGIFKAVDVYPELAKFAKLIDVDKFFVVNSCTSRMWHPQNLWLYLKLALILAKYDVLHATNFFYYYEYVLYLLRKKIVLTVHDPFPHSNAESNTSMVLRNRRVGMRLLSHFILLNKVQKTPFIEINKLQIKHVYDSRLGRYDYLKIYEKQEQSVDKYVLFFGQITSHKGLDVLFPAMKKVHEKYSNVKLVVAGRGAFSFDISEYEQMDYIDIQNRFIPDDELAELIQGTQFVVCPYNDATQSGVVMSAFAFNKPVVATNVGGLPEMIVHEQLGLIVPPRDVDSLADAMCELLDEDNGKLFKFSKNIENEYAEGDKSWKCIAQKLKVVYEGINQ